jgi:hypothetical protein
MNCVIVKREICAYRHDAERGGFVDIPCVQNPT